MFQIFQNELDGRTLLLKEEVSDHKVAADELLFMHVLTNIISNALKYSKGCANPEISISYKDNNAFIQILDFGD